MIPILYKLDTNEFDSDGLGCLTDVLTCTVTEERNGPYELEMTYPVGGQLYDSIKNQCIIKAKPNDTANPQLFRIYHITKPLNQIITVYAEHISYELAGNPVLDFNCSGSAGTVLQDLFSKATFSHKFEVVSDITGSNAVKFAGPHNVREVMGGTDGSVLDTFGGEYEWDNYTVILHAHRGRDNGVTVEYGKNLTDLTQDETIDSTYTCVVPYVKTSSDGVDAYHYLSGKYVNAPNADKFARPKALLVDFSDKFKSDGDSQPAISEDKLKEYAEQYIKNNDVGVPKVSLTIKYVPLWMLPEYAGNPLLERVNLCDTVTVRFDRLGVDAKARVNKITYNVLQERVDEAELGDAKSNFVDSYAQLQQQIAKVPQSVQSLIDGAVSKATGLITGAKGGHVVIKTDADKKPQEILIMDTEDINTAVHVWRWNINGFGYSSNGINGPYETAITMDGHILGKFIYALQIVAGDITAGRLKSADDSIYFDLDTGEAAVTKLIGKGSSFSATMGGQDLFGYSMDGMEISTKGTPCGIIGSYGNNDFSLMAKRYVNIYTGIPDGSGSTYHSGLQIPVPGSGNSLSIQTQGINGEGEANISLAGNGTRIMLSASNSRLEINSDGVTVNGRNVLPSDGLYRPSSNPINIQGINGVLHITTSEDGRILSCDY